MHDYLESEQVSARNKMYRDSGIVVVKHSDKNIFSDLLDLVQSVFVLPDQVYIEMGILEYREIILSLQEKTNSLQFNRRIAKSLKGSIQEFIDEEEFLIQSNTYLRATRPNVSDPESEAIGWHRETFYGPNMERSCNIWTPILNVSEENSLRFIPESQKILDDDIETEHYEEKSNEHGRASHKIGYPYKPKKILAGVNLNKQEKMIIPSNSSCIFSGNLIHGAAVNLSNNIRFSTDLRILPKSAYNSKKNKQFHISSEKPYFEAL
jgi:hypothetical protein